MAFFRPRRTVTDPSGVRWELYVTRSAMPPDVGPPEADRTTKLLDDPMELGYLGIPIAVVGFLWSNLVEPILRVPFAYAKGRRTHAARIEAVNWFGAQRETRFWTTTADMVDSVLEQVALGLEEGRIVQPVGAVFSGTRED